MIRIQLEKYLRFNVSEYIISLVYFKNQLFAAKIS